MNKGMRLATRCSPRLLHVYNYPRRKSRYTPRCSSTDPNISTGAAQKRVHFVGIGGTTLGPLALLAASKNWRVSGSDVHLLESTQRVLERQGVKLHLGHSAGNIMDGSGPGCAAPDVVVVSGGVAPNNPELEAAWDLGVPVYKRSKWLELFTADYSVVAVSGARGKSTTAAMLASMLRAAGEDVIHSGGGRGCAGSHDRGGALVQQPATASGTYTWPRGGLRQRLVVAADDQDGAFLGLKPSILVVTSVDLDRADAFRDEEAALRAFLGLAEHVEAGGVLLLCADDKGCAQLMQRIQQDPRIHRNACTIFTYGSSQAAQWQAIALCPTPSGTTYTLTFRGTPVTTVAVPLPGAQNVLNSVAAVAACALACTETHLLATQAIDVGEVVNSLVVLPSGSTGSRGSSLPGSAGTNSAQAAPKHQQHNAHVHPTADKLTPSFNHAPPPSYIPPTAPRSQASDPPPPAPTYSFTAPPGYIPPTNPTNAHAHDASSSSCTIPQPGASTTSNTPAAAGSFFTIPEIKLPSALQSTHFAAAAEAAKQAAATSLDAARHTVSSSVQAAASAMSEPVFRVASAVDHASDVLSSAEFASDLVSLVPGRATSFIASVLLSRSQPQRHGAAEQGAQDGGGYSQPLHPHQQHQHPSQSAPGALETEVPAVKAQFACSSSGAGSSDAEPSSSDHAAGTVAIVHAEGQQQAADVTAEGFGAYLQGNSLQAQREQVAEQVKKLQAWLRAQQQEVQQQLQAAASQLQQDASSQVVSAAQQLQEEAGRQLEAARQQVQEGAGRIMQDAQQAVKQWTITIQGGQQPSTTSAPAASDSTALTAPNSSMLMVAVQQVQNHLADVRLDPHASSARAEDWTLSEAQHYRAQLWHVLQESAKQAVANLKGFPGLPRHLQHTATVQLLNGTFLQLYDDCSHHPVSVRSCLTAARQVVGYDSPIWVVFEPSSFCRLQRFVAPFSIALSIADKVFVADAYAGAGGVEPILEAHATELVVATSQRTECCYVGRPAAALNLLTAEIMRHASLSAGSSGSSSTSGVGRPVAGLQGAVDAAAQVPGAQWRGPGREASSAAELQHWDGGRAEEEGSLEQGGGGSQRLAVILISEFGMGGFGEKLVASLGSGVGDSRSL